MTRAVTAGVALDRALSALDAFEPAISAWVVIDVPGARRQADAVDAQPHGVLDGLVLGVKDVFDTATMPTQYGSPIYSGNRSAADAAVVALAQRAGAVVLGKTVTAEFATRHPGPTRNPHRPTHTPGGSSSGSAAAVATGMADVALGTQTLGSVIRPASYCGVYGYKPTYGTVSVAGLKLVAPSLDTVGWFARDVPTLDRFRVAVTGRPPRAARERPWRFAFVATDQWEEVAPDARRAIASSIDAARDRGASIGMRPDLEFLAGLVEGAGRVMDYEGARSLAYEYDYHRDALSPELVALIDRGLRTDCGEYDEVLERRDVALQRVDELFGDADVLICAAATGEAPEGLESTGDPRCASLWTLLGLPSVSVPGMLGGTGLPVGVQLVGRHGGDGDLLAAAEWLGDVVANRPVR